MATPGELMAAALEYEAFEGQEVPAIIRELPVEDQAVLLRGAKELADVIRTRVAEIYGDGSA